MGTTNCINCEEGRTKIQWPFSISLSMAVEAGEPELAGEVIIDEVEIPCFCCGGSSNGCYNCRGEE